MKKAIAQDLSLGPFYSGNTKGHQITHLGHRLPAPRRLLFVRAARSNNEAREAAGRLK